MHPFSGPNGVCREVKSGILLRMEDHSPRRAQWQYQLSYDGGEARRTSDVH